MEPQFLELEGGRRIAFSRIKGEGTGVVFLGGFGSDMTGTKAVHLEAACAAKGRPFLRFDYTGHGQSSGAFEDGCIGDWTQDARETIDALTEGPQILVGSSMGGWIALLVARNDPARVAGLVGIAAAPDFMGDLERELDEEQRRSMASTGRAELPSDYPEEPFILTRKMFDDGRQQTIFGRPLHLPFPTRLLQGTEDEDVDQSVALRLLAHASGPDIRLVLIKGGDHRLSGPSELALIEETVESVVAAGKPQQ